MDHVGGIKEHIEKEYFESDSILRICNKYNLIETIDQVITIVQRKTGSVQQETLIRNAGLLLQQINPKLALIKNELEKAVVENLLSDLLQPYLERMLSAESTSSMKELTDSLQLTCEIHGYSYHQLYNVLRLGRYGILRPPEQNQKLRYEWLSASVVELDQMCKGLVRDKILISSWREFANLFEPNTQLKQVRFTKGAADLILVLVEQLYALKLIKPCGRSGKFVPISHWTMTLNGLPLYKNKPSRKLEVLKRNSRKYLKIKSQVNSILLNAGVTNG